MSNYTKSTNFATKDTLPSNDPLKVVKGTEIDTEYNNIATAVATKADVNSPAFTGTPTAPTAAALTNSTQIATTAFVTSVFPAQANTYSALQTYKDSTIEVVNATDATKKVNFSVSGVTTGTTRTMTVPDKSGTLALTSDLASISSLTTATNVLLSGSYSVSGSTTITFTVTNTLSAGQEVYIKFTNTSGSSLTAGKYTIASATGSSFTITYGSSVTSAGTFTAERFGLVAFSNSTEALDRTTNLKALSPATLRDAINAQNAAPIYAARAWVVFDANRNAAGTADTTNTTRYIYASGNVSSVTKTASGNFTIALTTSMPNANYAVMGTCKAGGGGVNNGTMLSEQNATPRSSSNVYVATWQRDSGSDGTWLNSDLNSVVIFG